MIIVDKFMFINSNINIKPAKLNIQSKIYEDVQIKLHILNKIHRDIDCAIIYYDPNKNEYYHFNLIKFYIQLIKKTRINKPKMLFININDGIKEHFESIVEKFANDRYVI